MDSDSQKDRIENIEELITEPLKFKAKLEIGEDAYASLRLKKAAYEAWDSFGAGATAVGLAQSSAVASTFFAPSGLLAAIGFGAAVTPIGWVIAAGVITSGAWFGLSRFSKSGTSERVTIIPKFINTPMDVLALGLFDLIAPLALKVADVDGHIHESERTLINTYFVKEWGYDQVFVDEGLAYIEANLSEFSIKELAQVLAEFKKANPDCNYEPMSIEIIKFLTEIMEVDGKIDEREELAIEKVQAIFKETNKISFSKTIKGGWGSAKDVASNLTSKKIFSKNS
jgi:uncharacterized tellurite resistance protein B-like protein